MMRRAWIAISLVSGLLIGAAGASGQSVGVIGGVMGGVGMGPRNGAGMQPYSATQKTTTVQRLLDGTTITRTTTVKMAQDSQGRTYRANQMDPLGPIQGRQVMTMFNVNDPVARESLSWNSQGKEVMVFHFPELKPRPVQPPPQPRVVTPSAPPPILRTLPDTSMNAKMQQEKLGAKTIAGVYAEGTRTTTTFPVGYFGNDRPLVVVMERWMSPDLRTEVMIKADDPRTGVRTVELTDIDRGEPDPGLFQVPVGYTVREQNPGN
jgi:hypothetical protein